jgi:hypothetical protein
MNVRRLGSGAEEMLKHAHAIFAVVSEGREEASYASVRDHAPVRTERMQVQSALAAKIDSMLTLLVRASRGEAAVCTVNDDGRVE